MRVLVTKHQGCLGTAMVPILQAAGHDVTGLNLRFFRRGEAIITYGAARQED
jgi:nucleoside-diphosphate-sugar epimerase